MGASGNSSAPPSHTTPTTTPMDYRVILTINNRIVCEPCGSSLILTPAELEAFVDHVNEFSEGELRGGLPRGVKAHYLPVDPETLEILPSPKIEAIRELHREYGSAKPEGKTSHGWTTRHVKYYIARLCIQILGMDLFVPSLADHQ